MTHADGRGSSGRLSPRQGLCHSPEEQQGRSRTGPAWREAAAPSRGPGLSSPARTAGDNGAASRYAGGLLPVLLRKLHAREKPAAGAQHLVRFPSFSSGFICMGLASVAAGRAVQAGRCPEERAVRRQGLPMTRAPRKSSSSCLLGAEDPPHTAPRRLRLYPPRAPLSRASAPSTDVPGRPDRPSSVPAERAGAFSRWRPFL